MDKVPVGWFVKGGQPVEIKTENGQSADDAIKEEATDAGVDPSLVIRGELPDDWSDVWKKKTQPEDTSKTPDNPGSDNPGEGSNSKVEPKVETKSTTPTNPPVEGGSIEVPSLDAIGEDKPASSPHPARTDWLNSATSLLDSTRDSERGK